MKFKNMKRFASAVMAGALALSLAAPAFAADPKTEITGTYTAPVISVVVPETGTATINPYKMPVSVTLSDTVTKRDITGQQIVSMPLSIRNQSTSDLAVNASLKVVPQGGVSIIAAAPSSSEKGKQMQVKMQVAGLNDDKYKVSSLDTTLEDEIIKDFTTETTWANAKAMTAKATTNGTAEADAAVVKSTDTTSAGGVGGALAVLGAATESSGLITYGKNSIAVFRLVGALNKEPVKTAASGGGTEDDPWATTDGFKAIIVFKFAPAEPAALTLDKSTLSLVATAGSNTGTVQATFAAGDTDLTATAYAWAFPDGTTTMSVPANSTANNVTVTATAAGTAVLTCTATLSDGTTKTATCTVTVTAAAAP